MATTPPLHGMRIIECSALGPAQITTPLVDLGAEVIRSSRRPATTSAK